MIRVPVFYEDENYKTVRKKLMNCSLEEHGNPPLILIEIQEFKQKLTLSGKELSGINVRIPLIRLMELFKELL